ncbi:MAG: Fe-S cluster assembly ATPase SufC [Methanobacteriota archaeon]
MDTLELTDLSVEVGGKKILDGINFTVGKGESNIIFGPNGSGKTTMLMTILGIPDYCVSSGSIHLEGKEITNLTVDERAKLGIGFGFQAPPEVVGVKLRDILKVCEKTPQKEDLSGHALDLVEKFDMETYLDRDVNVGFSGGERKRAEVLQLLLMKPKLLLLDEPDSGVDVDSLGLIASEIEDYLKKSGASALIITHQGHILDYIFAVKASVLMDGKIVCHSNPGEIFKSITEKGYRGCVECPEKDPIGIE